MTEQVKTRITFNKANLDAIPLSKDGKQVTYYDTNKTNLSIRVGANSKTFILYTRPKNGNPVRITLGKYGQITIKQASDLASKELAKLADGFNPVEEKKQIKIERELVKSTSEQTFKWMMETYKEEQIISHKGGSESTLHNIDTTMDYFDDRTVMTLKFNEEKSTWENDMEVHLESWHEVPFRFITRQQVIDRFEVLAKARPTRNFEVLQPVSRTNQMSFKFASSAFNYIIQRDELDVKEDLRNPFDILSNRKKWKKSNARTRFVDFNRAEFGDWWKAVEEYDFYNYLVSDYILFSLLQAGRSIDVASLKWKDVDMELGRITYEKTKNREEYIFPITKKVGEILKRRLKYNKDTIHVFDYSLSKLGHVPQDCQHHFKVLGVKSGKLISHHDLRRTWATASMSLDMNERMSNYCLKHTINDVNRHYYMRNESKIRKAMQAIEDFFEGKIVQSLKEDDEQEYQREMAA